MKDEKSRSKSKCICCGREVAPTKDDRSAVDDDTLCSRCYEKMMFPETRLKNMEIFD
ncbi:MAG: hypothetical protein PVG78_05140 [Desulfobacterales bacterium]